MAKYAISEEGIESLIEMAKRLRQSSENINVLSKQFYDFIEGISDGLGVYHKEILELVRDILRKNQESKEDVDILSNEKIPKLANELYDLWMNGLGDDTSSDEDPDQKRLVKKYTHQNTNNRRI